VYGGGRGGEGDSTRFTRVNSVTLHVHSDLIYAFEFTTVYQVHSR
jgi:hypothetical protein